MLFKFPLKNINFRGTLRSLSVSVSVCVWGEGGTGLRSAQQVTKAICEISLSVLIPRFSVPESEGLLVQKKAPTAILLPQHGHTLVCCPVLVIVFSFFSSCNSLFVVQFFR